MGWCNPLQSWKWSCLQGFYDSPCLGKPSMGAANIFFRGFAGSSGSDHGVPNPLNNSPCIFGETHKFETHKFGSCRNNIDEMQWETYRKIGSWAECHFQSQFVILIFLSVPMPCIPGKAFPILCFVGWSMTFVWSIPTYWVIALTRLACLKLKSSGIHVPVVFWMFPVWLLFQELLGVIVFLRMPHAFGKMLVCASLILRFTW